MHPDIAPTERHLIVESGHLRLDRGRARTMPGRRSIHYSVRRPCAVGLEQSAPFSQGHWGMALPACRRSSNPVASPWCRTQAMLILRKCAFTALLRPHPDHVVSLAGMPALFEKLVREPAGQAMPVASSLEYEVNVAAGVRGSMDEMDRIGRRSVLACRSVTASCGKFMKESWCATDAMWAMPIRQKS